jgi:hypothetical protein
VSLYRLRASRELTAPVLVAAFDGWVDASGASSSSVGHLARDADVVATFDVDALVDLRARRPILDIVDGTLRELTWPELVVSATRAGERDLLVFGGAEPDFRWRELASDVRELVLRLGVTEWISLGAIPAAVTHKHAVPVLATASAPGLLHAGVVQGPEGLLRVPSAALSAIELAVSEAGIPTVGFYAQVPHYVAGPYPAASVALLEHVGRQIGVPLPLEPLVEAAREHRARLDAVVASQPEAQAYLEQLEALHGAEERIPSGDEIAAELERFLRESGGGEDPNPFGER